MEESNDLQAVPTEQPVEVNEADASAPEPESEATNPVEIVEEGAEAGPTTEGEAVAESEESPEASTEEAEAGPVDTEESPAQEDAPQTDESAAANDAEMDQETADQPEQDQNEDGTGDGQNEADESHDNLDSEEEREVTEAPAQEEANEGTLDTEPIGNFAAGIMDTSGVDTSFAPKQTFDARPGSDKGYPDDVASNQDPRSGVMTPSETRGDTKERMSVDERGIRDGVNEMFVEATEEREQLLAQRTNLERKLAQYFASKKTEDLREAEKNVADQEQRYMKCLAGLDELREELQRVKDQCDRASMDLKSKVDEKEAKSVEVKNSFMIFKRRIALAAVNSRTGKGIPPKIITQFEQLEAKKDLDVHKVRLKNITLRNLMKKLELSLRQKEELADNLHLIDFEQLKIENQTYNEKIEERNEELLKLRKKITNTVQVLTHLKEKLQFVQGENLELKRELSELETKVAGHRDMLSKAKKDRDQLRMDNMRLRQQSGLVGADDLLRDFEQRKNDLEIMTDRLGELQGRHKQMTGQIDNLKRLVNE